MLKLHHVGIAVKDVHEAMKIYRLIPGFIIRQPGVREMPEFGVKSAVISTEEDPSNAVIELVEPMDNDARFGITTKNFLNDRGEGLFYITLFTDNFDHDLKDLKERGFHLISEEYKTLFPGSTARLAWLQPAETRGAWITLADAASVPESRGGFAP